MKVDSQVSGWESFVADRTERRDAATDDATRQHFEAELEQARITMQAMGLEAPQGTTPAEVPQPSATEASEPTEQPFNDAQFIDYDAKSPLPTAGSGELSENLGNLEPYREEILAAAEATGVPANLLAAVIWDESKGIASAGTINGENGLTDAGLMQLNPQTYADLQSRNPELLGSDATDPQNNIMAGALYLQEQHTQFGDWDLALRAYNSGPLSVDPSDHTISTTGFGTQNYVEKVNFYQGLLDQGQALPDGFPGGNQYY
jgi:soluble lytic murein transglycosylase-like protein